ncbi:MAG: hypothetical protein DI535_18215 [Citrobacter freundii]|nr:MAG: hypothetical protein DI535_18215 [Citrobacter freundii]
MGNKHRSYDKDLKERLSVLLLLYLDGLQEERQLLLKKKIRRNLVSLLKYYALLKKEEGATNFTGQVIALKIAGAGTIASLPEVTPSVSLSTPAADGTT